MGSVPMPVCAMYVTTKLPPRAATTRSSCLSTDMVAIGLSLSLSQSAFAGRGRARARPREEQLDDRAGHLGQIERVSSQDPRRHDGVQRAEERVRRELARQIRADGAVLLAA